jgi:hypothetical protein
MGYPESIKVHVTQVQRELLEFLVNRRRNDLARVRGGTETEEYRNLSELKTELQQAGT